MTFRRLSVFVVLFSLSTMTLFGGAEDLTLRNWIPALASHPLEEGQEKIAAMALPSAASHFIALSPCRLVDTRNANSAYGGPLLTGGVARAFNIPGAPACSGIPVAAAYSLNIAVTGSTPGSIQFLTAYPAGTARPLVASMNFDGGETTSNSALVPADATGSVEIYASTDTHVIIDINGYLKEGVVTSVTAGAGLSGGGTGSVTVGLAAGGVTSAHLGASSVTNGAIQDGAISAGKVAAGQVVKSLNGVRDAVTLAAGAGASVNTAGSTITVAASAPAGTIILGAPGDTTLIAAGYSEGASSGLQMWRSTSVVGAPSARSYHSAIWTGTRMIIWGGQGSSGRLNTGGVYDPVSDSWSPTSTGAGVPSPRMVFTAVWTGSTMIVWGGSDGGSYHNTGGIYTPATDSWAPTQTFGAPAGRYFHVGVWATNTNTMIVWGGHDGTGAINSGGLFNPAGTGAWSDTTLTNAPAGRFDFTAVWTGAPQNRMIVWGGSSGAPTNSGGIYDPAAGAGGSWTATQVTGAPSARYEHVAIWTGTEMIVWGGGAPALATGGRYNLATNSWTATSITNAPSARIFPESQGAVWTGSRMIVFWGFNSGFSVGDPGGIYDPASDSWVALSRDGAPTPRGYYPALWTGKEAIIFGGGPSSGIYLNTGGRLSLLSYYVKN